ncbi:MAG: hypothetical protein ACOYNI_10035 [Acidimicrobiia bacterium]
MTPNPPPLDAPVDQKTAEAPVRFSPEWFALHWPSIAAFLIVFIACLFCFAEQRPDLVFRNTTPAGGDVGAHVWWPWFVSKNLLPWRVAGWTMDWWAGFPVGQFYFPVPALMVSILDIFLPYNIALKLVLAAGPALLPLGAYVCFRGLRLPRPGPELAAVGAVFMVFFAGDPRPEYASSILSNQRISGGTLASSLAGEFAFEIALVFALCFIGAFAAALDRRINLAIPAVLFAATVGSHAVVSIYVVVAALLVVAFRLVPYRKRLLPVAVAVGAVGSALIAFWALPFVTATGYTTNIGYEKITAQLVDAWLLPPYLRTFQILAGVAIVAAIVRGRSATGVMATLTVAMGLLFAAWPEGHVWNLRFVPFWYLGLFMLAGVGMAEICRFIGWFVAAWVPPVRASTAPDAAAGPWLAARLPMILPMVAAALVLIVSLVSVHSDLYRPATKTQSANYLPYWVQYNMSGYEEITGPARKQYAEYRALIDTVKALPEPGRVVYEKAREPTDSSTEVQSVYGTDFSLYLLPYWTNGKFPTIEGLYFEASATTPYYFLMSARVSRNPSNLVRGLPYSSTAQFADGVKQMQLMGVKWFMATTPDVKALATANPGLRYTSSVPNLDNVPPNGWDIYEVLGSQTVMPLANEPVVVKAKSEPSSKCFGTPPPAKGVRDPHLEPWLCASAPWWENPAALDRPIVANGPSGWKRAQPANVSSEPKKPLPPVEVTNVRVSQDEVRFRVSQTGVPVMVNVSYFPNWEVEGAKGVYRASPNFMVVVPTSKDVTLTYGRTTFDWVGLMLTLLGLAGLVGLALWRWPYDSRAPVDPGDGLVGLLAPVPPAPEPAPESAPGPAPGPASVPPSEPVQGPQAGGVAPAEPASDYISPDPETGL